MSYKSYTTYMGLIIADFCRVTGSRTIFAAGKSTDEYRCTRHGFVELVRYFGHAKASVRWACPKCVEEHLEGTFVLSVEADHASDEDDAIFGTKCEHCGNTDNLTDCNICGTTCCPTHQIEGTCVSCASGIEQHMGSLYAGL